MQLKYSRTKTKNYTGLVIILLSLFYILHIIKIYKGTSMLVTIYLDDGTRDAWDYDNNYIYYDDNDKEIESVIMHILKDKDFSISEKKDLLDDVCSRSFNTKSSDDVKNNVFGYEFINTIYNIILRPLKVHSLTT